MDMPASNRNIARLLPIYFLIAASVLLSLYSIQASAITAPLVTITTPADETQVTDNTSLDLTATANDDLDGDISHLIQWQSDRDGVLGTGSSVTVVLSGGPHQITASAINSGGLSAQQTMTIFVGSPVITITTPVNNAVVGFEVEMQFSASANDAKDGDLSASITWNSSASGPITPDANGLAILPPGEHWVVASVVDSDGGSTNVGLRVVAQGGPTIFETVLETNFLAAVSADGRNAGGSSGTSGGSSQVMKHWSHQYGITNLAYLSGGDGPAEVYALSNTDRIVGFTSNSNNDFVGVEVTRTNAGSSTVELPLLYQSYKSSRANDITPDSSIIAGMSRKNLSQFEAVYWDAARTVHGIGHLDVGDAQSAANAISEDGSIIAGNSGALSGGITRAFRWDITLGMQALGELPGGVSSNATDISADGSVIVGVSSSDQGHQVALWDSNGVTALAAIDSPFFSNLFQSITGDGRLVVGQSSQGPYIWDRGLGMRDLQTYLSTVYNINFNGEVISTVRGISSDGRVMVGTSTTPPSTIKHGWIVQLAPLPGQRFDGEVFFQAGNSIKSSPSLAVDGTVYTGSNDNSFYALNSDGSLKWSYATGGVVESSASIGADGTVYVGSADKKLYAFNPDGTVQWTYPLGAASYAAPSIAVDGTIYIAATNSKLYAINPDGSLKWSFTAGGSSYHQPAIALDGTIVFGTSDKKLYALNPDGSLKWSYTTLSFLYHASPAIDSDGTIYIGTYIGKYFYAINPDGTLKWVYQPGNYIEGGAAIGLDGKIYFGTLDDKLYAMNPDGTLAWTYTTGGNVITTPAVGENGTIYIGSSAREIIALNSDGTLKWYHFTKNSINRSAATIGIDGKVYIGDSGGHLYVIQDDAQGFADTPWPGQGHDALATGNSATSIIHSLLPDNVTFSFIDKNNVALATLISSDSVVVAGFGSSLPITVTGGEYNINGGSYTTIDGFINNNNSVTVRTTSSSVELTAVDVVLNIGGTSDTFTLTTELDTDADGVGNTLDNNDDGDSFNDDVDNCTLIANDQLDTNADGYGNACDGDFNNDGMVNSLDIGLFKIAFFTSGILDEDLNGDLIVNSLDIGLFKSLFFAPPGPSGVAP